MGVTREHNLASPECSESSHAMRATTVKPGEKIAQLLLQGMPYGDMREQGMFFVCCANSPRVFKERLYSQVVGTSEGDYDRWLDFTNAETGGAYFAPSIEFIQQSVHSS
jgi:putative iron-dependent peroxidase